MLRIIHIFWIGEGGCAGAQYADVVPVAFVGRNLFVQTIYHIAHVRYGSHFMIMAYDSDVDASFQCLSSLLYRRIRYEVENAFDPALLSSSVLDKF